MNDTILAHGVNSSIQMTNNRYLVQDTLLFVQLLVSWLATSKQQLRPQYRCIYILLNTVIMAISNFIQLPLAVLL